MENLANLDYSIAIIDEKIYFSDRETIDLNSPNISITDGVIKILEKSVIKTAEGKYRTFDSNISNIDILGNEIVTVEKEIIVDTTKMRKLDTISIASDYYVLECYKSNTILFIDYSGTIQPMQLEIFEFIKDEKGVYVPNLKNGVTAFMLYDELYYIIDNKIYCLNENSMVYNSIAEFMDSDIERILDSKVCEKEIIKDYKEELENCIEEYEDKIKDWTSELKTMKKQYASFKKHILVK